MFNKFVQLHGFSAMASLAFLAGYVAAKEGIVELVEGSDTHSLIENYEYAVFSLYN